MFNKMFKVFQAFKKRIKPSREQSRQGKKSGQNRMWALWAEVSGGHSTDRSHRPTTPDQTNSAEETNSDKKKPMLIQYREMPDMFGRGMPTFDMDLHL